jgi:long-chain acyl-CoA synthetase
MTLSAILDSIGAAALSSTHRNLDFYRKDIQVPDPSFGPVRLSVLDVAPDQPQKTVVLLHGFAASSAWWYSQIESLAFYHRVIAIDLRGHGRSARPKGGYTIAQMVADTAAVLDALEIQDPVALAGHSVGGFIATDFALRYPKQVSHLVLVATPVAIRRGSLPLLARIIMYTPDAIMQAVQPLYELDPRGRGTAFLLGIKKLYHHDMTRWNGEEKFPAISQPALVIIGDKDYAFPEADYTRVAELIPQAERIHIGASKHQVPLERPKAVLRAIQRFIQPDPTTHFLPSWRSENDGVDSLRLLVERPWVARYDRYVPDTLHIPKVPLTRLLDLSVERFRDRPAIRYRRQRLTYAELQAETWRFARAAAHAGLGPGDRLLLLLPNLPHLVVAFYGTLRLGATVVFANPGAPLQETIQQANQTGVKILVSTIELLEAAHQIQNQSDIQAVIFCTEQDYERPSRWGRRAGKSKQKTTEPVVNPLGWDAQLDFRWIEWLGGPFFEASPESTQPFEAGENISAELATAAILFTAGTTASPRGVRLSHFNLVANALQFGAWFSDARFGKERILTGVPFWHAYGLGQGINLPVFLGACITLPQSLSPADVCSALWQEQSDLFVATPRLIQNLNDLPQLKSAYSRNSQSRKPVCLSAAAALPVEVKETFERLTRIQVMEGYGLSEASQMTHANPVLANRTGSIGLPLPGTEVQVVDLQTKKPLPYGQIGELWVRGPQVMQGYLTEPPASQEVLDEHSWLHTADVARMDDDGYFQILGRCQDMWFDNQAGAVFPRDVEEAIYELPQVSEVVVTAIQGEPVAFVCLHPEKQLSETELRAFCQRRLPSSHQPHRVIFVPELPHNFLGKVPTNQLDAPLGGTSPT